MNSNNPKNNKHHDEMKSVQSMDRSDNIGKKKQGGGLLRKIIHPRRGGKKSQEQYGSHNKTTDDIAREWATQGATILDSNSARGTNNQIKNINNYLSPETKPYLYNFTKYEKELYFMDAKSGTEKDFAKVKPKKPSWLCRTEYFSNLCNMAFDIVDSDGSGTVDEKELYSGLLLIHLKLGTYAGPAACRPLSRERCSIIFHKMDIDQSGTLDRQEFQAVMTVLFSNVLFRVLVQWSMTLLIVPILAQLILDCIIYCIEYISLFIMNLDEYSSIANSIELAIEYICHWFINNLPLKIIYILNWIYSKLLAIPESVWEALPLAIISTILGIVVVPWCIFQIDDFFQHLADRKVEKQKNDNSNSKGNNNNDNSNNYKSKPEQPEKTRLAI